MMRHAALLPDARPFADRRPRVRSTAAALIVALALPLGCGGEGTGPDTARSLAAVKLVDGQDQSGVVAHELAHPLVVRLEAADGRPLAGQTVNFRVTSGGGTVFAGAATSNADGLAQERWTLGQSVADSQKVEVRAVNGTTGEAIVYATFRATALADVPAAMTKGDGDSQTGGVAGALPVPLSVRVADRFGNPVSGAEVVWTSTGTGATLTPATATTDAAGVARATWTLGTAAGHYDATARVQGRPELPTIGFGATAMGGSAAQLRLIAGADQRGSVGHELAQPLQIEVLDAYGNRVGAVPVTWTVLSGGGTLSRATSTTSSGFSTNLWTLGPTPGEQTLQVGAAGQSLVVKATAGRLTSLVITPGSATATALGESVTFTGTVYDEFGSVAYLVPVTDWTSLDPAIATGTYISPANPNVPPASPWRAKYIAHGVGTARVFARAAGLTGEATYVVRQEPATVGIVGARTSIGPGETLDLSAVVRDANGSVIPGAPVTWSVSDRSIATIDDAGHFVVVGWGAVVVTVTAGPGVTSSLTINAIQPFIARDVSVGVDETCALTPASVTYCWGDPIFGVGARVPVPTVVASAPAFSQLDVHYHRACGLTSSGDALCWGSYGPMGDGSTAERAAPVAVSGGISFQSVSVGVYHSCGLATSGVAYCWGNNESGELGSGGREPRLVPNAVSGGLTFVQLETGGNTSCGLTADGAAYCWGLNGTGQLGTDTGACRDGSTVPCSLVPVRAAPTLSFRSIAVGSAHVCGIATGGATYCWGYALASGGTTDGPQPLAVSGPAPFVALAAGSLYNCALTAGGDAYCWGNNGDGRMGTGDVASSRTPRAVVGGLKFKRLRAGSARTCGITLDDRLYCWGRAALGDGGGTTGSVPVPVRMP